MTIKKHDVCIIVATFNRAEMLKETLESLLNQTRQAEKIIIIDDGSTDNTREIVAGFKGNIEYIFKENGGKSRAINAALKHTDADYIWIFDDDDIAFPHALESLLAPLESDPDMDFCHGGAQSFKVDSHDGKITKYDHSILDVPAGKQFESLLMGCCMWHVATLIRRHCYEALGGLDQDLNRAEDYDFLLRLTQRFRGVCITQKIFMYRQHEGDRGDESNRHSEADRDLVHLQFDQIIFQKLRKEIALNAYIGKPAKASLTDPEKFEALLNRAVSMGRHGLWDDFMKDIQLCHKYKPNKNYSLSTQQKQNISGLFSRYIAVEAGMKIKGFPYNCIDETVHALGKEAAKPMARGLYWALQEKRTNGMPLVTQARFIFYILYAFLKKL